jgi:uncharacterized protein
MAPVFLRAPPSHRDLVFRREMFPVVAGGTVALDWLGEPEPERIEGSDVLVVLHGLTGGSHERYVQWLVSTAVHDRGMVAVVLNARGCAGTDLSSAQGYCGSWTEDVRTVAREVRRRAGTGRVFAAGFSLGAGILTKYLVEEGSEASFDGAVALCPSFDFVKSISRLEQPWFSHIYNPVMRSALVKYFSTHWRTIEHFGNPSGLDPEVISRAQTVRDFDQATVAPMFGYDGAWDYYRDASTGPFLGSRVAVPYLALCAADDPICDITGVPEAAPAVNPRVFLGITQEGGHVAWATGSIPSGKYWYEEVCMEFFDAVARGHAPPRATGIPPRVGRASAHVLGTSATIGARGDGEAFTEMFGCD